MGDKLASELRGALEFQGGDESAGGSQLTVASMDATFAVFINNLISAVSPQSFAAFE